MAGSDDRKGTGRRKRPPRPPLTPEQHREALEALYVQRALAYAAIEDARANDDLRMRKDGSPSARAPAAVLPVSNWAMVTHAPEGDGYESVRHRLEGYRAWLEVLRSRGLYEGPVELTFTNPPDDPQDGD
jgi:hypothetical protein